MKRTKRFLCVALVLVMALGMLPLANAVGTPLDAEDFSDWGQVTNQEELAVMAALGVLKGYGDGSYGATMTFTRAEAAAIVTRLLIGVPNADIYEKSTAPTDFNDVPPDHWASGLISYAAGRGIIAGYGNGNFGPGDPVTAVQFAIMLMRVLGLATVNDFTGPTWLYDALIAGQANGLLTDSGDHTAVATRDQVALYAFNALWATAKTVTKFEVHGTGTVFDGLYDTAAEAAAALNAANGTTGTFSAALNIKTTSSTSGGLAATLFGLSKDPGVDRYGNPTVVYKIGTKTIYTNYVEGLLPSYTVAVQIGTLYTDLGLSAAATITSLWVDGVDQATTTSLTSGSTTNIAGTGRGVLTNVYRDGTGYKVTMVNTYIGQVTTVRAETSSAKRNIDISNITWTGTAFNNYETEDFAKDDYVVFTVSNNKIATIEVIEPLENVTVSSRTGQVASTTIGANTGSFVADGTRYSFNDKGVSFTSFVTSTTATYNLYVDKYNNVLYTTVGSDSSSAGVDYLYLVATATETTGSGGFNQVTKYQARVVFDDGSVDIVEVATLSSLTPGEIYTYTQNSSTGRYTLTSPVDPAATQPVALVQATSSTNTLKVTKGSNRVHFSGSTTADPSLYGDNNTIYVVGGDNTKTCQTYTGYRNVPTATADGRTGTGTASDPYVHSWAFIKAGDRIVVAFLFAEPTAAATGRIFISSRGMDDLDDTDIGDGTSWKYYGVVNGTIKGVGTEDPIYTTDPALVADGDYWFGTYTNTATSGRITALGTGTQVLSTGSISTLPNLTAVYNNSGVINVAGTIYTLAEEVVVYNIAAGSMRTGGGISVGSLSGITTSDGLVLDENSDGDIVAIYCFK